MIECNFIVTLSEKTLMNKLIIASLVAGYALLSSNVLHAQDVGISADKILIGLVTPKSSIFAGMQKQRTGAADAYIASVNAAGGVNGRKIVIIDRDDAYDPKKALVETTALIKEDKVFALLGAFGSPTLPVVMDLVESNGVPLVGAVTLSEIARKPYKKYVFPVRASALKETLTTVTHEIVLGVSRFAVLSSKEAYGPEGAAAFKESLKSEKLTPVVDISFGVKEDASAIAKRLIAANPQAILVAVLTKPFSAILKEYRALGGTARVIGFSAIRIEDVVADLGPLSDGVALSQSLPVPTRSSIPLVAEYNKVMKEFAKEVPPSYHGIDAYLEARILVEGLRKAGSSPTRAKLVAALEQLNNRDFGGVTVRYGEQDRTGSTYTDIVMIRGGRIVY
jgi:branched-chain amino acid transport system substrate-binding protein